MTPHRMLAGQPSRLAAHGPGAAGTGKQATPVIGIIRNSSTHKHYAGPRGAAARTSTPHPGSTGI
eukprot:595818-Prymnesium_polylepis.1